MAKGWSVTGCEGAQVLSGTGAAEPRERISQSTCFFVGGGRHPTPNSPLPPQEIATPSPYRQGAGGRPSAPRTAAHPPKVPAPWAWPAHRTRDEGRLCRRDPQPPRVRPPSAWPRDPIPLPPQSRKKGRLVTSSSGHSAARPRFTMEQKQAAQVKL